MWTRLLACLTLFMGLVDPFSWDIVAVSSRRRLEFYHNGTLTHTEDIPSVARSRISRIISIIYDPVYDRLLFHQLYYKNVTVSSFNLKTGKIKTLFTTESRRFSVRVAFDPVTQLLFWTNGILSDIYSVSLKPESSNESVERNFQVKNIFQLLIDDLAVDSCEGYIYWVSRRAIQRARFDGSERELLIISHVYERRTIAIDQQTKKMYWIEKIHKNDTHLYIQSADFNGENIKTFYNISNDTDADSLAVSKDFIFWRGSDPRRIWRLSKNRQNHEEAELFSISSNSYAIFTEVATHYTIEDQTQGNQDCEALKSLTQNNKPSLHGMEVSGESRGGCNMSLCHNYCLQGVCSLSAEGQPKCSCNTGYLGQRCEVEACYRYCLNNGSCSLNEEGEPTCQCTEDYEGQRCDVPAFQNKLFQTISKLRDILNEDIPSFTLAKEVKSTCTPAIVRSAELVRHEHEM